MKRDSANPGAEAIDATAAAWLAQRDDGLTRDEAVAFARWRAADPRHEAAAARLEGAWASLQQLRDFRPEAARHPDRDLLGARGMRRRVVRFPAVAAAVALAACVAVAAVWWSGTRRDRASAEQRYATTLDGYERVTLADGSMVELNSASEVAVQFSLAERRVRLVRGEAHFTVAKNPARPFRVEAGGVAVRAVGTAFNVRLGAGEVEVLVTEGKVSVAEVERLVPKALSVDAEARAAHSGQRESSPAAVLVANERTVVSTAVAATAAPVVERVTAQAVREALAWQGPRLVFSDTPLREAIAQFNRRNPVQLELADAELGALTIGGSFRAENVDAFVRLLEAGGDLAADRPDTRRVVLRRAK